MSDEQALTASLPAPHSAPQRRWLFWIVTAALVLVLVLLVSRLVHSGNKSAAGPAGSASAAAKPVPVSVVATVERDVPMYLDGLGNALPLSTVTVRSQVDGRLDKVLFKEGQSVKAGDVLAEIDPRPFRIQLHQAEATLARDSAQLDNARVALARDQALRAEGLNTQQELDNQQATVHQFEASLKGDQTQIEAAKLQLDYARVRSPISGVTGMRLVDAGNLVRASDPNGLVVVTQIDPMAISFNLPQDSVVRVQRALGKGPLSVEISNRDGTEKLATGSLTLVDNQINVATATVRLKATVPNPDRLLWPNQFVKVRLLVDTQQRALVIPAAAVQRGPDGALVYVVAPGNTAEARKVEVATVQDDDAIIAKGLSRGDLVIVEGQAQLRPHAKVAPRPAGKSGVP
jgi:multidrug efflux system membrane fusion protein